MDIEERIPITKELIDSSLVSLGNLSKLKNVIKKAQNGEKVKIATIGGSITQGACATTQDKCWASLTGKWWQDRFKNVEFINAGIGATGSELGVHRVYEHVLKYDVDLVVCEYAVNDTSNQIYPETFEGLVRQILSYNKDIACLFIFTMLDSGNNTEYIHAYIGNHYGIPMASFKKATLPYIESGTIEAKELLPDLVHPADYGHELLSKFVCNIFEIAQNTTSVEDPAPLPKPLFTNKFDKTTFLTFDKIEPVANNNWEKTTGNNEFAGWTKSTYKTDKIGSEIEFLVSGTSISLSYIICKKDMGVAKVQVDNNKEILLSGRFEADWGGYCGFKTIATNLENTTHKVKITLTDKKAATSNGNLFEIVALMSTN